MCADARKYVVKDCVFGLQSRAAISFLDVLLKMQEMWMEANPMDDVIPPLDYLQSYFCCLKRQDDGTYGCACRQMREDLGS